MRLHRDVDAESSCGGQVADGRELFGTDYWCVYCGAKWSERGAGMTELCSGSDQYGGRIDYEASRCPVCGHAVRHRTEDRDSGTLGARVRPHLRTREEQR